MGREPAPRQAERALAWPESGLGRTLSAVRLWLAFLVGAVLATAAFGAYPSALAWLERSPGILVGGQVPPEGRELEAWLSDRARTVAAWRATLLTETGSFDATFAELGLTLDVARTAHAAQLVARELRPLRRLRTKWLPSAEISDVPLALSFDPERARRRLLELAPALHRDPSDARLDLAAHARIDEVAGRELDLSGSLQQIAHGEREDGAAFRIVTQQLAPRLTRELLAAIDVTRVLSSYETDFAHHAGPRAINIQTAARYLNGALIAPGETFSFNRTVGARTIERGFTAAPQIVADELEPGIGGGVCQVASTLHAAAVLGGFEVIQRRSHSRPSGYTPLGLDATVVDGELDLKLRNPYSSPLIVHAFLPTATRLRIELLGQDAPGKIEHLFEVKEKHEFMRRVVVEPALEANHSERHQKGIWGYDVLSTVRTTYPNGQRSFRFYKSTYRPVPEVYWVGPGTDPRTLPPLPEGAQGVEFGADSAGPSG